MHNRCRDDAPGEDGPQLGGLLKIGVDGRRTRERVPCSACSIPAPTPRASLSRTSPRPKPWHVSRVVDTVAWRNAGSAEWLVIPNTVSEPYTTWVAPPRTVDHPSAFWAVWLNQDPKAHAQMSHHHTTTTAPLLPEASGHTRHQLPSLVHNFAAAPASELNDRCTKAATGAAVLGSIQASGVSRAAAATSWRRRGGRGT